MLVGACSSSPAAAPRPAPVPSEGATTSARVGDVRVQLVLPRTTMRAGRTMRAKVIVWNGTGKPLKIAMCGSFFQIALASHAYHPDVAWLQCLKIDKIPVGSRVYPQTIDASLLECGE